MIDRETVLSLYQAGLSRQAIASQLNVSRQRIHQLTAHLPSHRKGVRLTCSLPTCSRVFYVSPSRVKGDPSSRHFCCAEHFYAYRPTVNPRYRQWRHGCRLARAEVAKHFALQPEHVVHHLDGDQKNNDPSNLAVFASQADHIAYHHGKRRVTPLWRLVPALTDSGAAPTESSPEPCAPARA
jgi:DNA-binding transcriptional regulator LsrR (DeoR family)